MGLVAAATTGKCIADNKYFLVKIATKSVLEPLINNRTLDSLVEQMTQEPPGDLTDGESVVQVNTVIDDFFTQDLIIDEGIKPDTDYILTKFLSNYSKKLKKSPEMLLLYALVSDFAAYVHLRTGYPDGPKYLQFFRSVNYESALNFAANALIKVMDNYALDDRLREQIGDRVVTYFRDFIIKRESKRRTAHTLMYLDAAQAFWFLYNARDSKGEYLYDENSRNRILQEANYFAFSGESTAGQRRFELIPDRQNILAAIHNEAKIEKDKNNT